MSSSSSSRTLVTRAAWATHSLSPQGGLAFYTTVPLNTHRNIISILRSTKLRKVSQCRTTAKWQGKNSNLGQIPYTHTPGSHTQQTEEVSGVSAHWYAHQGHQHPYPHTCPQRHTQMYSAVHTRGYCSQKIQQARVCSFAAAQIPAAFLRLGKLLTPTSPQPEETVRRTTTPKHTLPLPTVMPPEHSFLELVVLSRNMISARPRLRPRTPCPSMPQSRKGIPPRPGARKRSTPVCRCLGREEVRS